VSVRNSGMSGGRSAWWWPLIAAAVAGLDVALELPAVVVIGALALLVVGVVVVGTAQRTAGRLQVNEV